MLKFGLLTHPTEEIIKEIKSILDLGFDFVEVGIEWPEGSQEILAKKKYAIKSTLKRYKSFAIGHTAWWIDFTSPYEEVRRAWIREAKKKIIIAKNLNIKLLNFHTSSRYHKPFYKKWGKFILDRYVRSMNELVPFAKKFGVKIILENAAETGEIAEFENFKYVADRIPNAKIHLDIAHANLHGGMNAIEKYILYFKDRIFHIHMHDNHGKFDEHLSLGKGKINFVRVVKLLKKIRYGRTITFEVFTSKRDAKKSKDKFKNLWNKY